jgi:hypothetical protein
MVKPITPEQGAELKRLYVELAVAYRRAVDTLRVDGRPLEGAALERLIEEDRKAGALVRRIRDIQDK